MSGAEKTGRDLERAGETERERERELAEYAKIVPDPCKKKRFAIQPFEGERRREEDLVTSGLGEMKQRNTRKSATARGSATGISNYRAGVSNYDRLNQQLRVHRDSHINTYDLRVGN